MNSKSMFLKIATAVLVITAVIVLPNFDKIGAQAVPGGLTVDVQVRNLTRGENNFQDSINAQTGDRVQVRIRVEAISGQTSIVVRNPLPARLVFDGGETGVFNEGGIALGNMNPGNAQILNFQAIVTGAQEGAIINTAFARSLDSAERSDSAMINASGAVLGAQQTQQNIIVRNRAMNLTRGETAFQESVDASVGDRLRIEIFAESLAGSFKSGDRLSYIIPYGRFAIVSGDANFILYGMDLGGIRANIPKIVTLEVVISGGLENKLTSTARVISGQALQSEAAAVIFIRPPSTAPVIPPNPPVVAGVATAAGQKTVTAMNRSLAQDATRAVARPGDVVAFQFTYRNTSAAPESVRIEADIKDIMMLARVSNTGGAVVDTGIIRFPAVNLTPNGDIIQTFEVTVFDNAAVSAQADRIMALTYGNQLLVQVTTSPAAAQVAGTSTILPPRTGASENLVALFSVLATGGYWFYRRKYKPALA